MNTRDLQKTLETQHDQLKLYEKKLKDVVRAYKSLDAEKSALQKALDSLSSQGNDEEGSSSSKEDTVKDLKIAIATLTRENTKKEAAFQNDKKTLLASIFALSVIEQIKNLQSKLQQMEADRERELTDHGKVLAEMQSRFAKEHQSFEAGAREVDHARELQDAVTRTKHSTQLEEQERASRKIAELEEKTMNLLETVARSEEARSEAHEALLKAEAERSALLEVIFCSDI
ncbi:unnamed protein product [Cylicostephanus goldi]|uniref:Uncharacterized protein n=1 Tax=Cylicostephanus goldi TaxID=71465 RepID=A0A3P6QHV5_CYLGO|nr:unnamed protein product [Cylicostephanus goldi]